MQSTSDLTSSSWLHRRPSDSSAMHVTLAAEVTKEVGIGMISMAAGVSLTHCDSANQWRLDSEWSRGFWRLQLKSASFSANCAVVLTNSLSRCLQGPLKRPPPLPLLSFCVHFFPFITASPVFSPLATFSTILHWLISKLLEKESVGCKTENNQMSFWLEKNKCDF